MLIVKTYAYMGKAVVSVHCQDIVLGHHHCLWTGERMLDLGDALDVLQTTAEALHHVASREREDKLDECTEECLGLV
jgi:hypothetical protein